MIGTNSIDDSQVKIILPECSLNVLRCPDLLQVKEDTSLHQPLHQPSQFVNIKQYIRPNLKFKLTAGQYKKNHVHAGQRCTCAHSFLLKL